MFNYSFFARVQVDRHVRFECNWTMDRVAEFRAWLDEFLNKDELPSHEWLLQRVDQALSVGGGTMKIIVTGPLDLRVLRKREVGNRKDP